jgi:hypothetical protein
MAVKTIYSGPPKGLYRPGQFLFFMDQDAKLLELRDFNYGATLVFSSSSERLSSSFNQKNNWQIWHVHHYGVTVDYFLKNEKAEVRLFGEDIPLREQGLLSRAPIAEVERIIKQEAENPRYTKIELEAGYKL